MAHPDLGSLLADSLDPPKRDAWSLIGYEPACRPRWDARQHGLDIPPCGLCPQELAAVANEYDVLYGGAAGGGKTKWLVALGLRECAQHPLLRAGLFRRTYDELEEGPLAELAKFGYGEALGCRWDKTLHELWFPNRAVIRFRYLENLLDATRRQGGEYQLLLLDEVTLFAPGIVDVVRERVRTWAGGPPVIGIRSTSNPGGASHGPVREHYIEATNHGEKVAVDEQGHTTRFIGAKVDDNPYVDPGYKARLQAIPDPQRRAAMLDGSWDIFAGQVFSQWRHERHVVQPSLLPESWSRYAGIDYGRRAPWCCLWAAEDGDGRIWVYRELYDTGVDETDQAKRILAAEADGQAQAVGEDGVARIVPEPPGYRVCDPAMAARQSEAPSIIQRYAENGCAVHPGANDRLAGWARLHGYLAEGPPCQVHRALGWTSCPLLHVFSPCSNLIRTLPALPYSQTRTEDVDTHAEDHAADALRYLLMSLGDRPQYDVISDETYAASQASELATPVGPFAVPAGQKLHETGADDDDGWGIPAAVDQEERPW